MIQSSQNSLSDSAYKIAVAIRLCCQPLGPSFIVDLIFIEKIGNHIVYPERRLSLYAIIVRLGILWAFSAISFTVGKRAVRPASHRGNNVLDMY